MRLCRLEDPGLWERRAVGHPSFYRLSSWKRQDRVRTFRRGREGSSDERSLSVVERLAEEAHVTRRLLQDPGVPFVVFFCLRSPPVSAPRYARLVGRRWHSQSIEHTAAQVKISGEYELTLSQARSSRSGYPDRPVSSGFRCVGSCGDAHGVRLAVTHSQNVRVSAS